MKSAILVFSFLASSFAAAAGETVLLKDCKVSSITVRFVETNTLSGTMNCAGGVQGFRAYDPDVKALIISAKTTNSSLNFAGLTLSRDQRLLVQTIEIQ